MLKHCSFLAYVLLLSILLTACAGDDDPEPTVTAPAATTAPEGGDDQESATATEAGTTPTTQADEPAGTMPPAPTENLSTPTDTVAYEPDPQVESALLDMLLEEGELPEEFELVSASPTGPSNEGLTFCNEEPFSRPES